MPDYAAQAEQLWYVCGGAKVGGIIIGAILWLYLRDKQEQASKGNGAAAKALILPVYKPLIAVLMGLLAVETVFVALYQANVWAADNALSWLVYEWIRDGFGCLFIQKNVSEQAFKRAGWMSLGWAAYGCLCGVLLDVSGLGDNTLYLYHAGVMAWYVLLIAKVVPRRDSLLGYAGFMLTFRSLWLVYYLITNGVVTDSLYYPLLVCIGLMELSLSFVMYLVMHTDTQYWRSGCVWNNNRMVTNKVGTNLLNKLEIGLLSDTADAVLSGPLPQLMEEHHARMIDFAYLAFDESGAAGNKQPKLLGQGAFSRVYRGTLRGTTPVAIKFFVRLQDVTAESIALFAKETAIMAAVSSPQKPHPNIVAFHGLCVRPPAILLVMEYCAKGSLFDVLRREHAALKNGRDGSKALLRMCADVARSLAFLHQLGFVHRDLKSLNYLVDSNYTVKLTDFGLSRAVKEGQMDGQTDGPLPPASDLISSTQAEPSLNGSDAEVAAGGTATAKGQAEAQAMRFSSSSGNSGGSGGSGANNASGNPNRMGSGNSDAKSAKSASIDYSSSSDNSGQNSSSGNSAATASNGKQSGGAVVHANAHGSLNGSDHLVSIPGARSEAGVNPVNPVNPLLKPKSFRTALFSEREPLSIADAEDLTRKVGSPYWMSPEMLCGEAYSSATDIYSLCVVLWEIWTGHGPPFPDLSRRDLKSHIVDRGARPQIPEDAPAALRLVLTAGWAADPRKRPSAQQIVDSLETLLNASAPNTSSPASSAVSADALNASGSRPPLPIA